MRKTLLAGFVLGGLLTLGISGVYANDFERFSPDEGVKHMTKELNLTPAQQFSVKTILEDQKSKMQPLVQQMKTVHEETQSKIEAVLTPEQKTKFQAKKEERKKKFGEMKEKRKEEHMEMKETK